MLDEQFREDLAALEPVTIDSAEKKIWMTPFKALPNDFS